MRHRFGPGFLRIDPDPVHTETGPVKVRDRTPVWLQSPFPFLKAPASGSSPERPSSRNKNWEDGFLLTNGEKTQADTSSPEVSKSKLSRSNRVEP